MGLIVIMVYDTLIKQVFFGEQGEVVRSTADAQLAAQRGTEIIKGLYNFMQVFIGALSVLMIVIAGFRMVTAYSKSEEQVTKARKQIMWAIAGIIVVGLSELLVKDIVFPKQGSVLPSLTGATSTIVMMTNFISSFIAVASIGMILYGGSIYITALGDQAKTQKGKKSSWVPCRPDLAIGAMRWSIPSSLSNLRLKYRRNSRRSCKMRECNQQKIIKK